MDTSQYTQAFIEEVSQSLDELSMVLKAMLSGPATKEQLFEAMRQFHSVKGASMLMGYFPLANEAMKMEAVYRDMHSANMPITDIITSSQSVVEKMQGMMEEIKAGKMKPEGE